MYGVAVLMSVLPSLLKSGACEGYVVVKNFEIIGVKLRAWVLKALCRKGSLWKHAKSCVVRQGVHVVMGSFSIVALVRVFDDKLYGSRVQVVVGIEICHVAQFPRDIVCLPKVERVHARHRGCWSGTCVRSISYVLLHLRGSSQ